jgi:hypothetical protein
MPYPMVSVNEKCHYVGINFNLTPFIRYLDLSG